MLTRLSFRRRPPGPPVQPPPRRHPLHLVPGDWPPGPSPVEEHRSCASHPVLLPEPPSSGLGLRPAHTPAPGACKILYPGQLQNAQCARRCCPLGHGLVRSGLWLYCCPVLRAGHNTPDTGDCVVHLQAGTCELGRTQDLSDLVSSCPT